MTARARTAHPYHDTDVIDARAPRFNQATVGVISLVATLAGWWPLFALLAAQLGIGLRFGRRYCLPCVAYFELIQPRFSEGEIEDSRPPKFANQVGFVVLSLAALAHAVGLTALGTGLGYVIAGLALLAATTGFCAGCELYRIGARVRGIRRRRIDRVELTELGVAAGGGELLVAFGHPLCTDCRTVLRDLEAGSDRFVSVDVRDRPDLARKYGVALVPTVVRVAGDGQVLQQTAGAGSMP